MEQVLPIDAFMEVGRFLPLEALYPLCSASRQLMLAFGAIIYRAKTNGVLVWTEEGTRFRYELDVAYHAHSHELHREEPVFCARIGVATIIDGEHLVVTIVDQTLPGCPASETRKGLRRSGVKELLNRHVSILQSDNEVLDVDSVQMAIENGFLVVTGSIIRHGERTAAAAALPIREDRPRTQIAVQTVDL